MADGPPRGHGVGPVSRKGLAYDSSDWLRVVGPSDDRGLIDQLLCTLWVIDFQSAGKVEKGTDMTVY